MIPWATSWLMGRRIISFTFKAANNMIHYKTMNYLYWTALVFLHSFILVTLKITSISRNSTFISHIEMERLPFSYNNEY